MPSRREAVAWFAAGALGTVFGVLTWAVVVGFGPARFDDDVERVVVDHRVAWMTTLFKGLTWLGSSVILWPVVGLTALALFVVMARRADAAFLVAAFAGSNFLTDPVKALVDRPRPPASASLVHLTGSAYPSGHAMDSLAAFVGLALVLSAGLSRRSRGGVFGVVGVVVLLVGWSRLYLGAHWLTDVLGGWMLSGCWVCLVAAATVRLRAAPARTAPYRPGPGP